LNRRGFTASLMGLAAVTLSGLPARAAEAPARVTLVVAGMT